MQVRIKQVNCEIVPALFGRWYATDSDGKIYKKDVKTFVHNLYLGDLDKTCTSSAGLMAHMIKQTYPQSVITIEANTVES